MNEELVKRLIDRAYHQGWKDACQDHLQQRGTSTMAADPDYPIGGRRKSSVNEILADLDPTNLLDLLGSARTHDDPGQDSGLT